MFDEPCPDDWSSAPLRELVDPDRKITYGIVQPGRWQEPGKGVPLIRGQDYSSGKVDVANLKYVHDRVASKYSRSTVFQGDILFSIVGYVGLCAVVPKDAEGANITQTTARVAPSEGIHSGYLAQYIRSRPFKNEIKKYTKGSAQPGLNLDDVEKMVVSRPQSFREQSAIARTLETLDSQIEKTQALIAKLEQVKEGLLHDLLTYGVDENGELRPSPEDAPKLYKQSRLGPIPEAWDAVTLEEVVRRSGGLLQTGPFGAQLHSHEYVSSGVPVIMPQDMVGNRLSVASIARVTEEKAADLSRHRVEENDLVFARRGELSRCISVKSAQAGWLCGTGCLLARISERETDANWLAQVYRRPAIQSQVLGRAVGSTMANLNTSILAGLVIGRPPIGEQQEVSRRLTVISERIDCERRKQSKLLAEKSGLMDDLLTGRVRVTPLLEREAAESN